MTRYLTTDWFTQAQLALDSSERVRKAAAGKDLVLQNEVTGGPSGDIAYTVTLAGGRAVIAPGRADNPTLGIRTDYTTSVEMRQGRMTPQRAFMAGKIKPIGNTSELLKHREVAESVDEVLTGLDAEY